MTQEPKIIKYSIKFKTINWRSEWINESTKPKYNLTELISKQLPVMASLVSLKC